MKPTAAPIPEAQTVLETTSTTNPTGDVNKFIIDMNDRSTLR